MRTEDPPNMAVVVADNHETVLQAVSGTLEKAGFTILSASTSGVAVRLTRDSRNPVNLAVIDTTTPGVNFAELSRELERVSPGIRTLFLTDESPEELLHSLPDAGRIRSILRKPFRRAQLLGQVLEMMDRPLVLTA
jgi:response regulator RpfG family c-di-GMP phosphodiesterase